MAEKKTAAKKPAAKKTEEKKPDKRIVTSPSGLNVRTSPEKGNNIKRILPYGTEVTVQAQITDAQGTDWAQIAPNEFIMQRFLRVE